MTARGVPANWSHASLPSSEPSVIPSRRPTARVTRWWVGRDNAVLTEPASSHANCLTAHRACTHSHHASPGVRCRGSGRAAPVLFPGCIIPEYFRDAVLGSVDIFFYSLRSSSSSVGFWKKAIQGFIASSEIRKLSCEGREFLFSSRLNNSSSGTSR